MIAAVVIAFVPGCASQNGDPTAGTAQVGPLDEASFDELAERVSAAVAEVVGNEHLTTPVNIKLVRLDTGGVEDPVAASAFAQRLADGVSDRLGGSVRFSRSPTVAAPLQAAIVFHAVGPPGSADTPGGAVQQRQVEFALMRTSDQAVVVQESTEYVGRMKRAPQPVASAPPRRAAAPRQPTPPVADAGAPAPPLPEPAADRPARQRVENLQPADDGSQYVETHGDPALAYRWEDDPEWHRVPGPAGEFVFEDDSDREHFWLLAQRASRTPDGRMRVEIDLRSRERSRNAELRFAFLDEAGRQVEGVPKLKHKLHPDFTTTIVITSGGTRPVHYICWLD